MIDWIQCPDSTRVRAIAYDEDGERILVQFPDGKHWQYSGCPPIVWEEFTRPGTSKGQYIHRRLNQHPNGPMVS